MDVAPWPSDQDAKIREWAGKTGNALATEMLDKLYDILGNAPKVERYAALWAPTTMELLANAQTDFALCVSKVSAVWSGTAQAEFDKWATKFHASLEAFKGVVDVMRKCLFECSKTITDVYRMAIDLVAAVAGQIVKVTTGIIGSIPNPLGLANVVGSLLDGFIQAGAKLLGDGLKKLQEFRSIMSEIEGKVASLTDLAPLIEPATNPGDWEVRAAS
jgi:uncharacterized protein YukE